MRTIAGKAITAVSGTAVMAAEKNATWGRRLSTPLGVALLGWGAGLALVGG